MTTLTTTQARHAWINITFLLGLATLVAGIYLLYGLASALIVFGGVLLLLSIVAVWSLKRRESDVNRPV